MSPCIQTGRKCKLIYSDQKPVCGCPGMVGREEMKEKFGRGEKKVIIIEYKEFFFLGNFLSGLIFHYLDHDGAFTHIHICMSKFTRLYN